MGIYEIFFVPLQRFLIRMVEKSKKRTENKEEGRTEEGSGRGKEGERRREREIGRAHV